MTDENGGFCTRCGSSLPPNSQFCPECGSAVDGGTNPYATGGRPRSQYRDGLDSTATFILIYGVLALIIGLMFVSMGVSTTDQMMQDAIDQAGYGGMITVELMRTVMNVVGACMVVSGATALVAGFFSLKCRNLDIALFACVISSIAALGFFGIGFLLFAIGIVMCMRINRARKEPVH